MPQLPFTLPVVPAGGEQPVSSVEDVRSVFPAEVRRTNADQAPVREAVVEFITETHLAYQQDAAYAAAQSDITRATGLYLDGLAGDHEVPRQTDELDENYRNRVLFPQEMVAPGVILEAVNEILDPHTTKKAQLFPTILDRLYLHDSGPTEWRSFLWRSGPQDNEYPDRYYDDRTQAHPGNSWVFSSNMGGRAFVLRVPVLDDVSSEASFIFSADASLDPDLAAFVADGTDAAGSELDGSVATFLFRGDATTQAIYQQIVGAVERLRGHGIRWILYVDPNL